MSAIANSIGVEVTASGAVVPAPGFFPISKAGVAVITLAAPPADGISMDFTDVGGHAHTITTPANLINGGSLTATFNGTVGSSLRLKSWNGVWYASTAGVTLS